jgi:hypothetical protein
MRRFNFGAYAGDINRSVEGRSHKLICDEIVVMMYLEQYLTDNKENRRQQIVLT